MGVAEKPEVQLNRAQEYGESILKQMREKPGDCNLFSRLVPEIANNPLIIFAGFGGGSLELGFQYLGKLIEIHKPHCPSIVLHEIPE